MTQGTFSRCTAIFLLALLSQGASNAQVPEVVHYQGRVLVDGAPFTGTGEFKFVLVDGGTDNVRQATAAATISGGFVTIIEPVDPGYGYIDPPAVKIEGGGGSGAEATAIVENGEVVGFTIQSVGSGYTSVPNVEIDPPPPPTIQSLWSNDTSSSGGSEPQEGVSLSVNNGVFSVGLGDTRLGEMAPLPAATFANPPVSLRIWFSDGGVFTQLTPDQPITATPYAMVAASVAQGAITGDQLHESVGVWHHADDDFSTSSWVGIGVTHPGAPLQVVGRAVMGHPENQATGLNSFATGGRSYTFNGELVMLNNVASGMTSFIGGGEGNTSAAWSSFIGGGARNTTNGPQSFIGGGSGNETAESFSFVGGGMQNQALGNAAFVGGGYYNIASGLQSFVGGGYENLASASGSFVGGGQRNEATSSSSFAGGGVDNKATGLYGFVAGGSDNVAGGSRSFAAGRRAKAQHSGTFVWADSSNDDFASSATNQFLIRASNGVGIGTSQPQAQLDVAGDILARGHLNVEADVRARGQLVVNSDQISSFSYVRFRETSGSGPRIFHSNSDNQLHVGGFTGLRVNGNLSATGTKNFSQPHPADPTLQIEYAALEGGEAGVYWRGTAALDGREAVIALPEHFAAVAEAEGLTAQVTPRGGWAPLYIASITPAELVVAVDDSFAGESVRFDFTVNGVRRHYADQAAIVPNSSFRPEAFESIAAFAEAMNQHPQTRAVLMENGVLNSDGTLNEELISSLGWKAGGDGE